MDIPWGSDGAKKFVTNVGLITSTGPFGDNIMAAEWTHHVSYSPALIAVCLHEMDTTTQNILKTKEFGVNLAAQDQNVLSSVSGGSHGKDVDKIKVLKDLGFRFYKGKKIKAFMVEGASLNAECKVIFSKTLGDHVMFVGEVQEVNISEKESLIYHGGKYFKAGENIPRPQQEEMDKIKQLVEKYKK